MNHFIHIQSRSLNIIILIYVNIIMYREKGFKVKLHGFKRGIRWAEQNFSR